MAAVGQRIYNRCLADFVSQAAPSSVGLASVPYWDIEAGDRRVEWARRPLGGVELPAMREGVTPYDLPAWDPFWGGMRRPANAARTHAAPATAGSGKACTAAPMMALEAAAGLSRRAILHDFRGCSRGTRACGWCSTEQPELVGTPTAGGSTTRLYLKWPAESDFRRAVPKAAQRVH